MNGDIFLTATWFMVHLLEAIGVLIISFTALKAFLLYVRQRFDFSDDLIKVDLAKALAVGLEFKLAAEIIKTVLVQTLDEVFMLAAIVVLRVILTYVIYWEIKTHENGGQHGAGVLQAAPVAQVESKPVKP